MGFRVNPAAATTLDRYEKPVGVFFDRCPSVDARQRASEWAGIVRPQSSWTNYVFGEDPLFPKDRPVVLFSLPPDEGDDAYLQHARLLVPEPPLVCLRDTEGLRTAASLAGATSFATDDVEAEAAREHCGLALDSLKVGDGFVELDATNVPTLVALIGPDHDRASQIYDRTLAKLLDAPDDSDATDGARAQRALDLLGDGDAAVLADHAIYYCSHGALLPLAFS